MFNIKKSTVKHDRIVLDGLVDAGRTELTSIGREQYRCNNDGRVEPELIQHLSRMAELSIMIWDGMRSARVFHYKERNYY